MSQDVFFFVVLIATARYMLDVGDAPSVFGRQFKDFGSGIDYKCRSNFQVKLPKGDGSRPTVQRCVPNGPSKLALSRCFHFHPTGRWRMPFGS